MNIKKIISNNLGIKVSAVLLSIIVWTYIWGERKANNEIAGDMVQRQFNDVPLALLKDSPSLLEVKISHRAVDTVVEGDRDIIEKIDKSELIAYIDVRGLGVGVYQLPPAWKIPAGIKIVVSSPEFVTAALEDKRIIEVKPLIEPLPQKKETQPLEVIK